MTLPRKTGTVWRNPPRESMACSLQLELPALEKDSHADVCIVGAGITGLTTAWLLAGAGLRVVVLEARKIGSGTTGRSTAILDPFPDIPIAQLIERHGADRAREVVLAGRSAVQFIADTVDALSEPCHFSRCPAIHYAETTEEAVTLSREVAAVRELGLHCESPLSPQLPFEVSAAAAFDEQAKLHPEAYLQGLAELAALEGAHLFEHSPLTSYTRGDPIQVTTRPGGRVLAEHLVLATHTPLGDHPGIHGRLIPRRSYVVGLRLRSGMPDGVFLDGASPYHYLRSTRDQTGSVLLLGGADHDSGHVPTDGGWVELERYARTRFEVTEVAYRWSAQLYESTDGLPLVGAASARPRIHVATGFGGSGIAYGTLAGMILGNELSGNPLAEAGLFRVSRRPRAGAVARQLVTQAGRTLQHVKSRMGETAAGTAEDIEPGQGRVIVKGQARLALYRDLHGGYHYLSARCPHEGCIVQWNRLEGSWDCPCHGDRYSPTGERLEGPSLENLTVKSDDVERGRAA